VALAIAACSGPGGSSVVSPTPSQTAAALPSGTIATSNNPRVFSLLANNHLLVADITTGAVLAELTLASPASLISQLHAMAIGRDGKTLFALVSDASGRATVAAVDTATLKVAATLDPGGGLEFRGLAVGPRTGRLYLFANSGGDAVVRVLDPVGGQAAQTWPARASGGRTWLVYQGAVASDESALYLSYHGPDTTGIDRFAIQATGLLRCAIASFPEAGCFRTHGSFALRDGELIAATGEAPWVDLDPMTGVLRGQFDLRLEGNHLMEFGIATGTGRLFAVGSCGYAGGLASVDLATRQTQVLAPSRTLGAICGERIVALGNGSLLVIAKTALPVPSLVPGALVVLSGDGKTLRTIKTSAEPIDLLLF
jgi:hypothetical protein